MNNKLISSLVNRFKKLAILLLLIPVLTGAVAYFFETRVPTTYIATSEVLLGNFQRDGLTNQNLLKDQISSRAFQENINEKYNLDMDVDFVTSKLKVESKPGKILVFSLLGDNEDKVESELSLVIEGFLKESNNVQQESIMLIEERLRTVNSIQPSESEAIAKEEFLYQLESKLMDLEVGTELNQPVTILQVKNDPYKRGVLGVIVGVMLSLSLLVFPELFKE
jgi:teichuronic acid biosynthesis protein TuaF